MRIASVASAFPENYYNQQVLTDALKNDWRHRLANPDILDRLDESMKVEGRYLVHTLDFYENLTTWGQANNAWIDHALELGEEALCKALHAASMKPKELSAIFVTSVTGIAAPSIDARLVNRMGLSTNIKRIPIFGLGCVAGAAGIARAADYVHGYPDQAAALLSVELCSLTLQRDDLSMAHLNSSHQIDLLPTHREGDGLGHLGKGLPHRIISGGSGHGCKAPGQRCRHVFGGTGPQEKRHQDLGNAHRRPKSSRGYGDCVGLE
jgi:alkylresorcinol/alkylpyrone synthase